MFCTRAYYCLIFFSLLHFDVFSREPPVLHPHLLEPELLLLVVLLVSRHDHRLLLAVDLEKIL